MRKTMIAVAAAVIAFGGTSTSASAFGLGRLGGFGLIHPGFGPAHIGGGYALGHLNGSFGGRRFGSWSYGRGGGESLYRAGAYRAAPGYGGYDYGSRSHSSGYAYDGQPYYGDYDYGGQSYDGGYAYGGQPYYSDYDYSGQSYYGSYAYGSQPYYSDYDYSGQPYYGEYAYVGAPYEGSNYIGDSARGHYSRRRAAQR